MSKKKSVLPQPPSEEFFDAFDARIGTNSADCTFCGRTWFNSEYHEPGELDKLRENAIKFPDKYAETDCSVGIAVIDGRQYVYGCPYNAITRYEDFIWNHRLQIADYINARAKQIVDDATNVINKLKNVKEG